ncbi:hypothetical protein IIA79_00970 [bacterium]|nr:hypothetical protein [bacterium]
METITLSLAEYVELLLDANVTDPEKWPESVRGGAALLARIREIEAACIGEHGEFDFDKLERDTQDEYDGAIINLNKLRNSLDPDPEPPIPLREYMRQRGLPEE